MKWILLAVAWLLSSCINTDTKDIEIESESDPQANFENYDSYQWLGFVGALNDPEGIWRPPEFDVDKELEFLINRELRERGWSEDSAAPDVLVAFGLGVDMAATGFEKNPETDLDTLSNIPQGALIAMLIDRETNFLVWVGVASAEFEAQPDAETAKARLDYAVSEMFDTIPD